MVAYSEDLKVFTKKNLEPISSLKKKKKDIPCLWITLRRLNVIKIKFSPN